ncbi:MAG: biotin--[acetyl-CoA-carboxylase] ligase [Oscillospiraceae bacterium]
MSTKNDILTILENERERFVSGQELGDKLNISRTAIWKAIKSLQEEGHKICAVTNKGYKFDESSDLISEEGIRMNLPQELNQNPIIVYKSTNSTNTQAKRLALEGALHGTVIVAEEQTAGRGRSGKTFFSPHGTGLYASVILRPNFGLSEPQMITIATAVAVCKAIEKLTELHPQIKWVNDIYLNGKKICGILTEAVTDFESGGIECIVVGVGINCQTSDELPEELHEIVGALDTAGISRNRLAAEIVSGIMSGLDNLSDSSCIDEYRSRSLMTGKHISFTREGKSVSAVVTGINDLGNLLVRSDNGEDIILSSGEVSLGHLPQEKS